MRLITTAVVILALAGIGAYFLLGVRINYSPPEITPPSVSVSTPLSPILNNVEIINSAFSPDSIIIKAGNTVTWINRDSDSHRITSDTGDFDSEVLLKSQTYSHIFDKIGTFSYHCSIHPNMKAEIIVEQ